MTLARPVAAKITTQPLMPVTGRPGLDGMQKRLSKFVFVNAGLIWHPGGQVDDGATALKKFQRFLPSSCRFQSLELLD